MSNTFLSVTVSSMTNPRHATITWTVNLKIAELTLYLCLKRLRRLVRNKLRTVGRQFICVIAVVVPASVLVCNYVYLQSEEHVRSTLSELTNGVYDKHCSKQKPSTVYYCKNLTV